MFHFPSFASGTYGFSAGSRGFAAGGFPIRRSPGQSLLGGSPELIAACHVLHRLLTPGHPPCALIRLTTTQRMKEFRTPSRIGCQRAAALSNAPANRKIDRTRCHACSSGPPSLLAATQNRGFGATEDNFRASRGVSLPSEARRARPPSLFEQRMVEVNGIEPMASWLQTRRSPN
jgi:hypothetical protein